jgi:hypothetical protein
MKNKTVTLLAIVIGLSGVSIIAQDAPPPGQPRPPGRERGPGGAGGAEGGMRMRIPVMAALDTNNDGTIDEKEIEQASKSLKTLDKNSDGKLTPDELRPQRPERPSGGARPERPAPPQ